MLGFDDAYDKEVTDIYEKEVEFESSRRVYSSEGESPTLDTSKKGGFIQVKTHNLQQRSPDRPSKLEGQPGGSGPLSKEDGTTYCLESHNLQAVETNNTNIRRLTPTECERLQGFPDGWTEGQSDTQRYKQLGNAVSVPVVKAVGDKLRSIYG